MCCLPAGSAVSGSEARHAAASDRWRDSASHGHGTTCAKRVNVMREQVLVQACVALWNALVRGQRSTG